MGEDSTMSNNVYSELVTAMKHLTKKTIASTQPMNFVFGTVTSVKPLQITIGQKLVLGDEFLILTNAVRDHSVDITVNWTTENEQGHVHGNGNKGSDTTVSTEPHKHDIKGRKKITIHNGLTIGEKVLLLRAQGGQDYIVIDRVDEIPTTGEGS